MASVVDEWDLSVGGMILTEKIKSYTEKILSLCHFVNEKPLWTGLG